MIGKTPTPREFVRHLIVSIQPYFLPPDDIRAALSNLLDCPNLKKVEINIVTFMDVESDIDRFFGVIAGVCSELELDNKLGDDGLQAESLYSWEDFPSDIDQSERGFPFGTI